MGLAQNHHHRLGSLLPKVKTGQHQRNECAGRGPLTSSDLGNSYLPVFPLTHQPHQTPLFSKEKQSQTAHPTDTETLGGIDLYWCKGFTKQNLTEIVKIMAFLNSSKQLQKEMRTFCATLMSCCFSKKFDMTFISFQDFFWFCLVFVYLFFLPPILREFAEVKKNARTRKLGN